MEFAAGTMRVEDVIIGGGPAGLACAKELAKAGRKVLVVDKKRTIGTKVCAGGITWSGLIQTVPEHLIEQSFAEQHIYTRIQHAKVQARQPIIATVNRENLGRFMAEDAQAHGARIVSATQVISIDDQKISVRNRDTGEEYDIFYTTLVGADGSNSLVRRYLGLPCNHFGIGINYQIPGKCDVMEWHMDSRYFTNGYGWIFPHKETISIGAYVDHRVMLAGRLKTNLLNWAASKGYRLENFPCQAERINFDYRGWKFGATFLAGDAAGFASALTGEGIYPAIVSGREIAKTVLDSNHPEAAMNDIIKKQQRFAKLVMFTGRHRQFNKVAAEITALALRSKLINFSSFEMAS